MALLAFGGGFALTRQLLPAAGSLAGKLHRPSPGPALVAADALHVHGNELVNARGHPVVLHGVNYSGAEYACIEGWGIFDGPSNAAMARAIASWHANAVRLLLNEDCWLGINGVPVAYGGDTYRRAIEDLVHTLNDQGLYVELSLTWAEPGTIPARAQEPMPDAGHAIPFWQSVVAAFKDDPFVIFGAYGEPHGIFWPCWLRGGAACPLDYEAVGMQGLVDTIRAAGAHQPIAIPGINFANNLSEWLAYEPQDPLHDLLAEFHMYGKNACDDVACWDQDELPLVRKVPLLTAEFGESYDHSECGTSVIDAYMAWADPLGVSYLIWTWNVWPTDCLGLISNFNGTPAGPYGAAYRAHLAELARAGSRGQAPGG